MILSSMKKDLCVVYNNAPHYREGIFRLIDTEYNCIFIFGKKKGNIKQLDTSVLRGDVLLVDSVSIGGLYFQKRVVSISLFRQYNDFLFLGETRCVSTWIASFLIRLLFPRKKIYFWTHGWYGKESNREVALKKIFFRMANGGVFLYGNYARKLMIDQGFNPNKLFVIHNSLSYDKQLRVREQLIISPDFFQGFFHNDFHTLVFVGRLTPVKRLDILLEAVCKTDGTYNLLIIGDGIERERLLSMADKYKINDRVLFYGPSYNEEELGSLISNADLCVSPGNVGLTAMHAMVYGTPVLTHNDFPWQMPEFEAIVPNVTGAFFHRNDSDDLAKRIDEWFNQPNYNRELIRQRCYKEIDKNWTPEYQINILKNHIK